MSKHRQQREAKKRLAEVLDSLRDVIAIHYSCESFYDRPQGRSARITSIAVRNLGSGQTRSFSIHKEAERRGISFDQIQSNYDNLERHMLDDFYVYVQSMGNSIWLHWNMRDANYGFPAIAHRYEVLGGIPTVVPESRLVDFARTLKAIYGPGYVGHPNLKSLCELNSISLRDFLEGRDEAEAFEGGEYVKLHLSTLRKVDIFDNILSRYERGKLKTNSPWWYQYGSLVSAVGNFIQTHPIWAIISAIIMLVGLWFSLFGAS